MDFRFWRNISNWHGWAWFKFRVGVVVFIVAMVAYWLFVSRWGSEMRIESKDNFAIVLLTLVLAMGAVIQSMYLDRQDDKLQKSLDDGLENAKRQQRAYLSIEERDDSLILKTRNGAGLNANYFVDVAFDIMNRGQTPAKDVKVKYFCSPDMGDAGTIDQIVADIADGDAEIEFIRGEYLGTIHSSAFTAQGARPLYTGTIEGNFLKNVLAVVVVEYKDVFGDNHKELISYLIQNVSEGLLPILYPKGCLST